MEIEGQQSEGAFRLTKLRFPDAVERADVRLTNLADVNVAAGGGGSIAINARNINISGGSVLRGGLETGKGNPGATAGDIMLNATGAIAIADSVIFNTVQTESVGNSGNINITTGSLSVTNGAQVIASTFGQGNAGDVTIQVSDTVSFEGLSSAGKSSAAFSTVEARAVGNGGDINIKTGSLSLTDSAFLSASTYGQGNAGSVNINARDTVSFDGVDSNGFSSGAFSTVEAGAVGNGGNLNITSGSLSATNGATLVTSTFGYGDAGNVSINARDTVSFVRSAAFSTVQSEAVGNSGDIDITTGLLAVTNGAALVVSTRGQGNAGNVNINALDTVSFNGVGNNQFNIPKFSTVEIGRRNEGSVTINVRDPASFAGEAPDFSPSGVLSQVESTGVGRGGSVRIAAGSISVTDGAVLTASTLGQGDAGSVIINATTFEADSGGQVLTTTSSGSKAGNININTADSITLSGSKSGLFANTTPDSTGDGGSISIDPIKLTIMDGAGVAVDSQGTGNAGNLLVQAGSITLDGEAFLSAAAASGTGGNIKLDLKELLLMRGNSQISATSASLGNEGNITIDTGILAAFENSDIIANAFADPGANIKITAQGIFGTQTRGQLSPESDITATGKVELYTPDVDPSQGIAALPAELVDASGLIASGCGSGGRQGESEFIITGRGGLPYRPGDASISPYPTGTVRSIPSSGPSSDSQKSEVSGSDSSTNPTATGPAPIVEALLLGD